jgi:hypothetical protein
LIKDILTDLTKITRGIKFSVIKVTGDDKTTEFKSMADDNSVVMKAVAKTPIKEFQGVFGLGNLEILRGYLDIYNSYDSDTKIDVKMNTVERNGVSILSDITFKASGQSSANYRLIGEAALSKTAVFNGLKWDAELDSVSRKKIQEFSRFAGVMGNYEKKFTVKKVNDNLVFLIGDQNASVSKVELDIGKVSGNLKSQFAYPLTEYLNILSQNSPVLKFSDKGFAVINLDSGLIDYEFVFMGGS